MHIQNVPRQNVPGTKHPKGQNVPRDKTSQFDKTSQGQNVPETKRPKGQNVPKEKTSQGTKHHKGQNVTRDKTSQWTNEALFLFLYSYNLPIIRITLSIN